MRSLPRTPSAPLEHRCAGLPRTPSATPDPWRACPPRTGPILGASTEPSKHRPHLAEACGPPSSCPGSSLAPVRQTRWLGGPVRAPCPGSRSVEAHVRVSAVQMPFLWLVNSVHGPIGLPTNFQLKTSSFQIYTVFFVFLGPGNFKIFRDRVSARNFVLTILTFFSRSQQKIRSKFQAQKIWRLFEEKCPRFGQFNGYW